MKNTRNFTLLLCLLAQFFWMKNSLGQQKDTIWSLQNCIRYASQENIQIKKTSLTNEINRVNGEQNRESRFPSLNGNVNQDVAWGKTFEPASNNYDNYARQSSTGLNISSNVILFNGGKIKNSIKQSELDYKAGQFDTETIKENISLSILNAYLQILYAEEQVKNSEKQVESSTVQLSLAENRVALGAISKSDYLQVKSQLATEKQTLANAESLLAIDKVTLMQLLELPVSDHFKIVQPDFDNFKSQNRKPNADSVFNAALQIKPQIKSAELNKQSADLNINIARAAYLPQLSLNAGIGTGYSNIYNTGFNNQITNRISPSAGLTLTIPIYQNRLAKSKVDIAIIGSQTSELNETDTRNQLRKSIEQACVDVVTAEIKYKASQDQYDAASESYQVSSEKFSQGLLSSVDYLIQKTNLVVAESDLLQSKYNLIFSYKTLDFYSGIPLNL